MHNKDPEIDHQTADVWGSNASQPYASRSINTVFSLIIILLIMGGLLGWYFLSSNSKDEPHKSYQQEETRNGVYSFFYKMFNGISNGLDDHPLNVDNVARLGTSDLIQSPVYDTPIAALPPLKRADSIALLQKPLVTEDEYKHSLFDAVGREVYGREGETSGTVHDILVHMDTGQAKAIIIHDDNAQYERDLMAVHFVEVVEKKSDGDVLMTIPEGKDEAAVTFHYDKIDNTAYISLRLLRDSLLLDYEGKVAGRVDAVIYEDARAQNIYFTLSPLLAQEGVSKFSLPFVGIDIIERSNGYDVQLTKAQTKALAQMMFKKD
tara:strand:- start:4338 stop:5300 length:963 start_codon:yes stop_codon:yes gene_type:complete